MGDGASLAIKEGLFQKFPVPDYALAYHINPELESGRIGLMPGPVFAGVKLSESHCLVLADMVLIRKSVSTRWSLLHG